jgi:hypothetical protein
MYTELVSLLVKHICFAVASSELSLEYEVVAH